MFAGSGGFPPVDVRFLVCKQAHLNFTSFG